MGLFDLFGNKEEIERKKNEKNLKEGWIYSTDVLPYYEDLVNNHEWEKALRYCLNKRFVDDLSKVFEPYFPNDCREIADERRMIFINHIFHEYCSSHKNVSEDSISFLARKYNNLQDVPVNEYMREGKFSKELYEEDSDQYNPFMNYFGLVRDIYFDLETTETLYNLYEEEVVSVEDLLGLSEFAELFDKQFFDTMYLEKHIREAKERHNGNK